MQDPPPARDTGQQPGADGAPRDPIAEGVEEDGLIVLARTAPDPSTANDTLVAGAAAGGAVFALAFAVALVLGAPIGWYGSFLMLACFSLALAIRRYFFDRFPEVEAAELRDKPDEDRDRPVSAVQPLARRPFLTRVLVGAAGIFGVSLLALVPSLGPRVGRQLRTTPWADGVRLKTTDDDVIDPDSLTPGTVVTAWPEGDIGFERAAVLVMRLSEEPQPPTIMDWVVDGRVVAYSKICTHAGCPVALFRERDNSLFCPCHQSTFDVARACAPTFGPAARPLPQLPLGVDGDGVLVARGDFEDQAGPTLG